MSSIFPSMLGFASPLATEWDQVEAYYSRDMPLGVLSSVGSEKKGQKKSRSVGPNFVVVRLSSAVHLERYFPFDFVSEDIYNLFHRIWMCGDVECERETDFFSGRCDSPSRSSQGG